MAEAALSRASLYLDDLSQPRLLPPQASSESRNLQQLCRDFMDGGYSFSVLKKHLWLRSEMKNISLYAD